MLTTQYFKHRFIPASKKSEREKILVVLHGLGDSLQGYTFLPSALAIPEFSYLLINAPDSYYGGYSWFDFQGDPIPGILRSRNLLLKLVDELEAQGMSSENIFFFGFSQGGLMVTDLGLRCGKVLGGICAVSGTVAFVEEYPQAFAPVVCEQKFLVTHGRFDPILPYEPSASQFKKLQELGVKLEFRTYDKDHTILEEELGEIAEWFKKAWG